MMKKNHQEAVKAVSETKSQELQIPMQKTTSQHPIVKTMQAVTMEVSGVIQILS